MQSNDKLYNPILDPARRKFFSTIGKLGVGAAAGSMLLQDSLRAQSTATLPDTAQQIFQAMVVAEDLLTVFYFNGLIGQVIQDPALAGLGGTATTPSAAANAANVDFLRAAMAQEITHANLLRSTSNLDSDVSADPYQTFYFPAGTFDTLASFTSTLMSLETALIAAYLTAIREFSLQSFQTPVGTADGPSGGPYSSNQLQYFAQVAASIMGVECEHRVLGGVILNQDPPNNLNFESINNFLSVYTGSNSAVAALMSYTLPSTGPAYALADAINAAATIGLPSSGVAPAYQPATLFANPNPIGVAPGLLNGATTIIWNAPSASIVEVHIGSPDGPLFARGNNTGEQTTGNWVTNGTTFYLQDVSANQALTSASTLATVTVTVTAV